MPTKPVLMRLRIVVYSGSNSREKQEEPLRHRRTRNRNRNRSKRRAIYCPDHGCYLDSVSQKYRLYADRASQLQDRGVGRRQSLLLVANQNTVLLDGEWLEAFWCPLCEATTWYHVIKTGDRTYDLSVAPQPLWQQVSGVIPVSGNPSVSEFTFRHSHPLTPYRLKDFKAAM